MSNTVNLLSPPWLAIRAQLRSILAARAEQKTAAQKTAAQKTMERELADYTSENDLAEMNAILDRHGDALTEGIRGLLGTPRHA